MTKDPHFVALQNLYLAAPITEIYRPAIEISDSRFTDWSKAGAPSLIADNGNEGQVIFGQKARCRLFIPRDAHEQRDSG